MKRVRTILTGIPGSPYVSNLYWGDSMAAQAANDATASLWASLDNYMVSDIAWSTEPVVVEIDAASGATTGSFLVSGTNGVGALSGDVLPPMTQMLVRWRTGEYINGRELRGRLFVPGMPETGNSDGVPAASTVTAMDTAVDAWRAAFPGLLLWSRKNGESRAVVSSSVWNQYAVLRSRRD